MRFAILAFLILGVFAAGAALDWSSSIRTEVPAIELRPAPLPELTEEPAQPIARTTPAKPTSAERKSRSSTPELRPVSPPVAVDSGGTSRVTSAPSEPQAGSTPRQRTQPAAQTQTPQTPTAKKPAGTPPSGNGGNGGASTPPAAGTPTQPPTTPTTTQSETVGAAAAPAPPAPAGESDDDDDGGGGGDDDDDGDDD